MGKSAVSPGGRAGYRRRGRARGMGRRAGIARRSAGCQRGRSGPTSDAGVCPCDGFVIRCRSRLRTVNGLGQAAGHGRGRRQSPRSRKDAGFGRRAGLNDEAVARAGRRCCGGPSFGPRTLSVRSGRLAGDGGFCGLGSGAGRPGETGAGVRRWLTYNVGRVRRRVRLRGRAVGSSSGS